MNDQDIEALKFEDKIREKKYMLFFSLLFWCVAFGWGIYFSENPMNSEFPFIPSIYPYYSPYVFAVCYIIFSIFWIKILNDFGLKIKYFIWFLIATFLWGILQNDIFYIRAVDYDKHRAVLSILKMVLLFFMSASFCLWIRYLVKISEKKFLKCVLISSAVLAVVAFLCLFYFNRIPTLKYPFSSGMAHMVLFYSLALLVLAIALANFNFVNIIKEKQ
ncbi:hypothetical protein [Campylobacter sp. CCS1377]|uniref:Uncharacterized protein n=1 Tax=Campylobacter sp. CCS1377 TaxID=3158229 RepID=A0AAU7E7C1_9BACT